MPEQSASPRTAKPIIITAIVMLLTDFILIIMNLLVDIPRLTLLAPVCITATSLLLLIIAFLQIASW